MYAQFVALGLDGMEKEQSMTSMDILSIAMGLAVVTRATTKGLCVDTTCMTKNTRKRWLKSLVFKINDFDINSIC